MWHSSDSLDASVNNLAVHTHPAMGMVVTPYPKEWARCHIHAHRDGARGGACGVRGMHGAGEADGACPGGGPARGTWLARGMLGRWAFQLAAHNVFGLFADASLQPHRCHIVSAMVHEIPRCPDPPE